MLGSSQDVENLVEALEVRFLANRVANLHFGLLTDFRDAREETLPEDEPLLQLARKRIEELNEKYGDNVLTLALDVTDKTAVDTAVRQAHDHFGRLDVILNNAGYGQFGARVVMSKEDWDFADRTVPERIRPRRDIEAKDGDKLTLGDTTITMHLTPGHTPGTISSIYKVTDHGKPHTVATWGGTTLQGNIVEPAKSYIASAERYRDIVKKSGADVILANHTAYDNTPANLMTLKNAKPNDPNPYVVGNAAVLNYITTAEECAKADYLARSKVAAPSSR